MRKILLITLEYPPQKGGVASYYGGMVEELRKQGQEVGVVAESLPPPSSRGRGGLMYKWLWPRWVKGYFRLQKWLKTNGGLASGAPEARPLLFVGHLLPLGTIAYLLRKRVPYVVFTHGMDVLLAQKSRRKKWLARKILGQAKFVVANSEFTKSQLSGVSCQVSVVYPCPNIAADVRPEEVDALRRRLGLIGKKIILTLGRVVERKGHDLVLRALPEILQHVPKAVYVVAGDGPDLGRLQKLVGSGLILGHDGAPGTALQPSIRFVGAVSDEERPLYYALCDLFVMPSRQIGSDVEGFGLSFLEAALFGKTSVGGRSGGIPEAILDGKTGALVDPTDPSALARVVVQLLRDDALRHEFGQNAKARVIYEFRWEKQVEKLIQSISYPRIKGRASPEAMPAARGEDGLQNRERS